MKPLDPEKCPIMKRVLDAVCRLYDTQDRPATNKQINIMSRVPLPNLKQALRALQDKGYVKIEKGGLFYGEGRRRIMVLKKIAPLYRSNGEPYKRDMAIAAEIAEKISTNPLKPRICEPGYPIGYKSANGYVTVRSTAPHRPSTEGMW